MNPSSILCWNVRGLNSRARQDTVRNLVASAMVDIVCLQDVSSVPGYHHCHTLKYLILGCEYLLQYVHLSMGLFVNFKDLSGNYSIYPRARSIYFYFYFI
jgi:endonuclease/exonuclease/phosphatase family metal-dependent hydrolase